MNAMKSFGKRLLAVSVTTALMLGLLSSTELPTEVFAEEQQIMAVPAGELENNQPQEITIEAKDNTDVFYDAFKFHTSHMKSFYSFTFETEQNWEPSWYVTTTAPPASKNQSEIVRKDIQIYEFQELGGVACKDPVLKYDTDYYLCIARNTLGPMTGTIKLIEMMDEEADTAELSMPVISGKTEYGRIESTKDLDVFSLKTGTGKCTLKANAEKQYYYLSIYSDEALTEPVYQFTISGNEQEELTKLSPDTQYYICIKWYGTEAQRPGPEGAGYDFTVEIEGGSSEPGPGPEPEPGTENYLKTISESKYFVTNMTSKVSAKIKNGKLTLKKGKDGMLCRKAKMQNGVFTKIKVLKKKKYAYKLAENCKIVYGGREDGTQDEVKSEDWLVSNFAKNGPMYGQYNIGVCLDKGNQVTMIYVSGFDVGAEQT